MKNNIRIAHRLIRIAEKIITENKNTAYKRGEYSNFTGIIDFTDTNGDRIFGKVRNADFKLYDDSLNYPIVWYNGTWENGIWSDGYWWEGTWESGNWENGVWHDGLWKNGTWNNGTFENGTWINGFWITGIWENGFWKDGLLEKETL